MEQSSHSVLIVDDEEKVGKALVVLVDSVKAQPVFVESGKAGLEAIRKASEPFSLIICNQGMPGMKGAEFLKEAKQISPDSIRFLSTGFADVGAIADAVNGGAIHRYIAKPWDDNDMLNSIEWGLAQYELIIESEKLLKLAKEQSSKLYSLNSSLKESSKQSRGEIVELDREISELRSVSRGKQNRDDFISELELLLAGEDLLDKDSLNGFYLGLISEIFTEFQDLAARNGFDIIEEFSESQVI